MDAFYFYKLALHKAYAEDAVAWENEERIKELETQVDTLTTENTDLKNQISEAEKERAKAKAQAVVKEAIEKAEQLPEAAKSRLLERFKDSETADGIEEAIQAELDYIAKLSEAGVVKNLGNTGPGDREKEEQALRESLKKAHPDWSDSAIEIAVKG